MEIDDGRRARRSRGRSRGTPRIANNLLRRVRDYAQVRADNRITRDVADQALAMLDIDEHGLDEMDKRILETIVHKFSGGPVGLGSLAVSVGEEADTIEEVYEPYLIQEGYLKRTAQGPRGHRPLLRNASACTPAATQQTGLSCSEPPAVTPRRDVPQWPTRLPDHVPSWHLPVRHRRPRTYRAMNRCNALLLNHLSYSSCICSACSSSAWHVRCYIQWHVNSVRAT